MEDESKRNKDSKRNQPFRNLKKPLDHHDVRNDFNFNFRMTKEDFEELSYKVQENYNVNDESFLEGIKKQETKLQKAVSSFICSAIGDALGVHTEFIEHSKSLLKIEKIEDIENLINKKNKKRCELGEFSDDTAMALCLADSLFYNDGKLNPIDLRIRFLYWWYYGYNNCRKDKTSFGLGGNIHQSFEEFIDSHFETEYFKGKDGEQTNGNGSLMRNASVPISFSNSTDNIDKCMEIAYNQSKTTHSGREAAECCQVLSYIVVKNINDESNLNVKKKLKNRMKDLNAEKSLKFCHSVKKLILSEDDSEQEFEENKKDYVEKFNENRYDRNWKWKEHKYEYSPTRLNLLPGYVGSYCMDALAMALHIVYRSKNCKEAIFKAVSLGGDADTVACIVGQIAGSVWGLETEIVEMYKKYVGPNDNFKCARIAYLLYNKFQNQVKK